VTLLLHRTPQVGMYCVAPEALPEGFSPEELPCMGASPDAVIRHRLPIRPSDLREARELVAVLSRSDGSPPAVEGGAPVPGLGDRAGLEGWLPERYRSSSLVRREEAAVAAAEAVLRRALSGALRLSPEEAGGPTASSSTTTTATTATTAAGGASEARRPVSLQQTWGDALRQVEQQLLGPAAPDHPGGDEAAVLWVHVREAVEVKNHSPFAFK
jgi:hypothetical protein